jgi:hypothetical protein
MNAPSLSGLRSIAGRDVADEKMDQVRELLVGDAVRRMEARVTFLESRVGEFEMGFGRQLDALQARIEALAGGVDGERRASFEALAASVSELSEQIRRISRG